MRSIASAIEVAPIQLTSVENFSPARMAWICESMRPGMTVRPPRSMTRVPGPEYRVMSADAPVAMILSPRIAIAWVIDDCASSVMILPLIRTVSAGCAAAGRAPANDSAITASAGMTKIAFTCAPGAANEPTAYAGLPFSLVLHDAGHGPAKDSVCFRRRRQPWRHPGWHAAFARQTWRRRRYGLRLERRSDQRSLLRGRSQPRRHPQARGDLAWSAAAGCLSDLVRRAVWFSVATGFPRHVRRPEKTHRHASSLSQSGKREDADSYRGDRHHLGRNGGAVEGSRLRRHFGQ